MQLSKETEARLQVLARAAGVPVAEIVYVLEEGDGIGAGYVMQRVEGESIARRILRDEEFSHARQVLARQCGEAAARIHQIEGSALPPLREMPPGPQLEQYRRLYDDFADPHPVFEWAFRWLEERAPASRELRLVHGDFRHGNIIVGPDGLRAVLDWEGAHVGDPMEDLAWICVYSWRFGVLENPVGGFGRREDLFAGYEAAGGSKVDPAQVRWWEIFGSLKWGIMCQSMGFSHLRGVTRSMEKATIGRRASETEVDLLNLILIEEGL
jgi:aminoglycoside phosphotransferase (APT) family kinase protein